MIDFLIGLTGHGVRKIAIMVFIMSLRYRIFATMNTEYLEFLEKKKATHTESGFDIKEEDLNPVLFDFQKFVVRRALKKGRYAIFSGTGTGKSLMEMAWAEQVVKHTGKPVLILGFLAVADQIYEMAKEFGFEVKYWDEHWQTRYEDCNAPMERGHVFITNYEQLDNVNLDLFSGVVADEAGIMKNFEGAIRNKMVEGLRQTPYKLACTATPSPNDPMELGNQSEFLNVMSRNEMLAMYFVHDGGETSKWRLKGHAEQIYWDWVSTWAIMFQSPADIGFDTKGYDLPPLNIQERQVKTTQRENGLLFNDTAVSATNFNKELRLTKIDRLDIAAEIVNNSSEIFLIWVKQNEEGDYLKKLIPGAVEVKGNDDREYKREKLLAFAKGEIRVLITKIKIAGWGMNFQKCHNQIFAAPDFSFEGIYQGMRRSYRFKQDHPVNIYLITTDTMQNVTLSLKRKEEAHQKMQTAMIKSMTKNLNLKSNGKMKRENKVFANEDFTLKLGDCVQLSREIPDESVDISVFSPPFASLYTYSDELEDMGNSKDYKEFITAFDFLVEQLFRVTKTGRLVCVHCMDLPIQKGKEGYIGIRSFSNMIINSFEKHDFVFHTEVVLWKNPVTEMQRTKALGLLHKQLKKDAAMSRVGLPDKLLVFRKDGEAVNPVHVNIPVEVWQKWASPVWMDIDFGNTLNVREAREEKDERHIAPLSLDIIERVLSLWSNEGDLVLTPFAGIGSEIFQAVKMNRRGLGFELKQSYYKQAVKNCMSAEESKKQLKIF